MSMYDQATNRIKLFVCYNTEFMFRTPKLYKTMRGAEQMRDKANAKLGKQAYQAVWAEDWIAASKAHKEQLRHSLKVQNG